MVPEILNYADDLVNFLSSEFSTKALHILFIQLHTLIWLLRGDTRHKNYCSGRKSSPMLETVAILTEISQYYLNTNHRLATFIIHNDHVITGKSRQPAMTCKCLQDRINIMLYRCWLSRIESSSTSRYDINRTRICNRYC